MNPKVSIVILNWNGRKYLEQFLPSVCRTNYSNLEIIVADNGSTDDSIQFLTSTYPSIRIIHFSENYGFAKGYNEALKLVETDYYVLLNSDVEVTEDWIRPVIDLMEADLAIAVCQPKIRMFSNKELFEYAGACGGWLDYLGYPFARGRIFDICEKDNGQYDNPAEIFWSGGAAMFVRSGVYQEVGGLDEYFFAHQEEIDFCWRVQLAGYKILVCPASTVYHVGGGTLPKGNKRKVYLNFRNNLVMLAKNFPLSESIWKIPFRFVLDMISAIKSLFEGEGKYFVAVIESHLAFIGWLFSRKDRRFFPKKRGGRLKGYYHKSVVWMHFIKGKTRFIEIVGSKE